MLPVELIRLKFKLNWKKDLNTSTTPAWAMEGTGETVIEEVGGEEVKGL